MILDSNITIAPKLILESIEYYMVGISKLPGVDNPIKHSSNESVLGLSAMAIETGKTALKDAHLYPEVNTDGEFPVGAFYYSHR